MASKRHRGANAFTCKAPSPAPTRQVMVIAESSAASRKLDCASWAVSRPFRAPMRASLSSTALACASACRISATPRAGRSQRILANAICVGMIPACEVRLKIARTRGTHVGTFPDYLSEYSLKGGYFESVSMGSVKKKVDPTPSSLSAHTRPPCASTMPFTMARPRPMP